MKYTVESNIAAWINVYVEADSEAAAEEKAESINEKAWDLVMDCPELKARLAAIGAELRVVEDQAFTMNGVFADDRDEEAA